MTTASLAAIISAIINCDKCAKLSSLKTAMKLDRNDGEHACNHLTSFGIPLIIPLDFSRINGGARTASERLGKPDVWGFGNCTSLQKI